MTMQTKTTWQKVKLGDVAQDIRESYLPTKEEKKPYVGLEHIEQQSLQFFDIGRSDETQSAKKVFKAGDILFGTLRPYFRKVVRPKFNGVCSTDIAVIRPTQKSDGAFLKYFIASQDFIDYASNISAGTRMPRASWKTLKETIWSLPELDEQKQIADVLSAYDDLIENNTKRIKILEQIAQAIYKEWFVYFRFPGHEKLKMIDSKTEFGKIPEGWSVKNLLDITDVKYGKNLPTKFLDKAEEYNVYGAAKIIGRYKEFNREKQTVIVGCRGSVGQFTLAKPFSFITNNSFYFDFKEEEKLFYFYQLKTRGVDDCISGSAQPQITINSISSVKLFIPPKEIISMFSSQVAPVQESILNLENKNDNLRQARDLLLPKLVSGEIEI